MIAIESQVVAPVAIVPVPYNAILDDPNSSDLFRAYAEACIVPDAEPQRAMYSAMDQAGIIQCFGAYVDSTPTDPAVSPLLIGFGSVICSIVPHDGHLVATLESLFVDPAYRSTGAFEMLMRVIEKFAVDRGCRCFVCQARTGSAYDKILSRRVGYSQTHSQYTRWLNGYSGGKP